MMVRALELKIEGQPQEEMEKLQKYLAEILQSPRGNLIGKLLK